jgi:hypothetical protein
VDLLQREMSAAMERSEGRSWSIGVDCDWGEAVMEYRAAHQVE